MARLDLTIRAMGQRRASLHTHMMVAQLCLYDVLASHTQAGSVVMQGCAPLAASAEARPDDFSNPSDAQRAKRARSPPQIIEGVNATDAEAAIADNLTPRQARPFPQQPHVLRRWHCTRPYGLGCCWGPSLAVPRQASAPCVSRVGALYTTLSTGFHGA